MKKPLVPVDDQDLKKLEGMLRYHRGDHTPYRNRDVALRLVRQLRACRKIMRPERLGTPVFWHWTRPGLEFSGCPQLRAGDMSTDTYAERVNCPRCKKLKTCRKAIRDGQKVTRRSASDRAELRHYDFKRARIGRRPFG